MTARQIQLSVEGMTCSGCAASIKKFLESKGGQEVSVDFSSGEVNFQWDQSVKALDDLDKGIAHLGFRVIKEDQPAKHGLGPKLLIAGLFTFPLLLFHVLHMIPAIDLPFLQDPWIQLFLCIPVFLIGILHFGKSAWFALRQGVIHMDVLIFIGSSAAFVYSLIGTLSNNPELIFYETSAMIITLVLIGNYIEKRSLKSTRSALDELAALKADEAKLINPDGNLETIPAANLKQYARIRINEGDVIPADVVVISGEAYVDESMISGESRPLHKKKGDVMIGATTIISGHVDAQVMQTMEHSTLHNIIKLVKQAQQDKPDVQRLADKISGIFVPLVIGISLLTFGLSYFVFDISLTKAVLNSIAVLVISCPCAMGLATPTAVTVGVGRVSKEGILIRSAHVLEKLAGIKKLLLDKTGTLTSGAFDLEFQNIKGDEQFNKDIVYQLESHSSHPIAKSICSILKDHLNSNRILLKDVREIKGQGVEAFDESGDRYFIGTSDLDKDSGNQINLMRNEKILMRIALKDQIRSSAKELITHLKSIGIHPVLLSGDGATRVESIASELAIAEYYGQKSPEEKLQILTALRESSTIAMVGDGINDAAVLAKADVGISLSSASQIAINSADVVILNDDLSLIERAISISKATLKTIKQNLFWAFSYNIIAIPLAAFGFLNPMWGALFMTFSDIMVIGNSIRLKYRNID
jgi:Cu+-exporting ATPase